MNDLDIRLSHYENYYDWTQRVNLIRYLRKWLWYHVDYYEEIVYTISFPASKMNSLLQAFPDKDSFWIYVRRFVLAELITQWYDWFLQRPYWFDSTSWMLQFDSDTSEVFVTSPLFQEDDLDYFIDQYYDKLFLWEVTDFSLAPSVFRSWKGRIFLFKSTEDLQSLGLWLVSHRSRVNNDVPYRRKNIATSFSQIGHVRVLNPWDELSYLEDSQFDPYEQQLYEVGYVIAQDIEKKEYWGGLCWWSTAIYQWIVTNRSLARPELRNHSKWYHYLYDATIDWKEVTTPWIDSTIYSSSLDLRLKNTASHPIVLVLNYDWEEWALEEVFSLGYETDKWWLEYISSRPYYSTLHTETWTKSVVGKCYTWDINGEMRESCYKEVKY